MTFSNCSFVHITYCMFLHTLHAVTSLVGHSGMHRICRQKVWAFGWTIFCFSDLFSRLIFRSNHLKMQAMICCAKLFRTLSNVFFEIFLLMLVVHFEYFFATWRLPRSFLYIPSLLWILLLGCSCKSGVYKNSSYDISDCYVVYI